MLQEHILTLLHDACDMPKMPRENPVRFIIKPLLLDVMIPSKNVLYCSRTLTDSVFSAKRLYSIDFTSEINEIFFLFYYPESLPEAWSLVFQSSLITLQSEFPLKFIPCALKCNDKSATIKLAIILTSIYFLPRHMPDLVSSNSYASDFKSSSCQFKFFTVYVMTDIYMTI